MRTRQVRERTAKGSRQRPLLGVLASGAPLRCLPKIIAWLRQLWALAGSACRLLCLTFPCPTVSHANVKVRFVVRVWWWILVVMGFGLPCLARLRGMMRVCICFLFFWPGFWTQLGNTVVLVINSCWWYDARATRMCCAFAWWEKGGFVVCCRCCCCCSRRRCCSAKHDSGNDCKSGFTGLLWRCLFRQCSCVN